MSSATMTAGDELLSFIKLAREIFHDEPWDQVQHYVERAWRAGPGSERATWAEIQALVRAGWE